MRWWRWWWCKRARWGGLLLDFGAHPWQGAVGGSRSLGIGRWGGSGGAAFGAESRVAVFAHGLHHKLALQAAQGRQRRRRRQVHRVQIGPHEFSHEASRRGHVGDVGQVEGGSGAGSGSPVAAAASAIEKAGGLGPLQRVGEGPGGAGAGGRSRGGRSHHDGGGGGGLLVHEGVGEDEVEVQQLVELLSVAARPQGGGGLKLRRRRFHGPCRQRRRRPLQL